MTIKLPTILSTIAIALVAPTFAGDASMGAGAPKSDMMMSSNDTMMSSDKMMSSDGMKPSKDMMMSSDGMKSSKDMMMSSDMMKSSKMRPGKKDRMPYDYSHGHKEKSSGCDSSCR